MYEHAPPPKSTEVPHLEKNKNLRLKNRFTIDFFLIFAPIFSEKGFSLFLTPNNQHKTGFSFVVRPKNSSIFSQKEMFLVYFSSDKREDFLIVF